MADFNEMDALELPEMNGTEFDYTNAPDASEDLFADLKNEEPVVGEVNDDFSDMPMPVLSEMDGSAPATPAQQTEKPAEPAPKPVQPAPAFEEMGGYTPVLRPAASQSTAPQSTVPQNNAPQSSTYRSVYAPVQPQPETRQSAMDTLYSMRSEEIEAANEGEKLARTIGIILIVLAVLGLLSCLSDISSNVTQIIRNVLQILIVRGFMQGNNRDRLFLGWLNVIGAVGSVILIAMMSTLTGTLAEYGMSALTTIMQLILFVNLISSGIMAYFLLINKKIKAYCGG